LQVFGLCVVNEMTICQNNGKRGCLNAGNQLRLVDVSPTS
jgi:hypothetical protein